MDDGNRRRREPIKRHADPYYRRSPVGGDEDGNSFGGVIEGRNAVLETLRAGRPIDKVYIAKGETDGALGYIAREAKSAGAVVVDCDRRKLDGLSVTRSHQGVIALLAARPYAEIEDILNLAREKNEPPLIIVCDEIQDPHNLGAIIRTAEAAGAHGVIIPKRRSAGITAVVSKTSAGAVEHVLVARAVNITSALEKLKSRGVWIYGAAADGEKSFWETDFRGATAVVIGSEGGGVSRLVKENCDFAVKIPMCGKMSSLNASVSAAILMYEIVRQRKG